MSTRTPVKSPFFLVGLLLLSACGGGGGGGGNGGFGGGAPALADITLQNAPAVAGTVAQQALANGVFDGVSNNALPFAGSGPGPATAGALVGMSSASSGMLAAQTAIEPCDVAGTIDVNATVANPQTLTAGDEFSFQYADCDNGTGVVVDGGLGITVTAFEGDVLSGVYLLGMRIDLSAFRIDSGNDTAGASGAIEFEIDTRMAPITVVTLTASSLSTTVNGVTETVTGLSITTTRSEGVSPAAVTVETSFRLSSPALAGDVVVTTPVPLQSFGTGYPYAGEIEIRGADNASIRLIALDANMVRLEIDANGDGAVDEVRDMTWEELLAAAA